MKDNFFKLNKPLYDKTDVINVCVDYDESEGGYIVITELRKSSKGFIFGKTSYQRGIDDIELIIKSGRRSSKKAQEAEKYVTEHAREYAEKYLNYLQEKMDISGIYIIE